MNAQAPRSAARRRFLRSLPAAAIAAATALILSGCTFGAPASNAGGASSTPATGATSIAIDISNYPSTLDPGLQYDSSTYSVYRNIYDQLLRRDPKTQQPTAWIATKWSNPTPTTWDFTIRSGVTFSDGSPLTAEDVAFSISRIIDPKFSSPQFANFSAISAATASSPTELTITTAAPSPTLLSYLTTLSIVPKAYVEKVGNAGLNTNPIGSGPYEVASATSGSQITLKANPGFWGTKPSIPEVVFRAVPDASSRVADLQSGQAQLALDLTSDQATQLKSASGVQVLSAPTERVAYLALNVLGDTPTKNEDIRKAIALGIDYDSIIKNLLGGYAKPVGTVLTPLSLGYPDKLAANKYDPAAAKKLVQESGIANPTLVFPSSPSYNPQLIQAIQSDLQKIGITVTIKNTDQATYLKSVQSPSHDWGSIRFGLWSCSCLDADGVLLPLFKTGSIWASYSNPDFDAAVTSARKSLDATERKKDYATAIGILNKDVAGIGLYQVSAVYGASSKLTWKPDAVQSLYVDQMKLGK